MTRLGIRLERLTPRPRRQESRVTAGVLLSVCVLLGLVLSAYANCNGPPPVHAPQPLAPIELPADVAFRCCSATWAPVETGLVAI